MASVPLAVVFAVRARPEQRRGAGPPPSHAETWIVFALSASVVAMVGLLAVQNDAVSWKALAALSHAQDILRQEGRVNLALIGFVEPPLPALLQLPLAWIAPSLVRTGDAAWVLGAILAGLTLTTLNRACADLGVGRAARWVLGALALFSPPYLGLAATGSPDALYLLLLLGGSWALFRWQRDAALRDLISASLWFSLLLLTRYDAVAPLLAATAVVTLRTLTSGGRWAQLEGTLITFLLPIAYVAGLWVLANRVIIGDAWHFWRAAWNPENGVPSADLPTLQGVLAALTVFPALPAALWWAGWGGASGRPRLATGAALVLLAPAIAVIIAPHAFRLWQGHALQADLPLLPLPELLAPLLAAGWFLAACALGDLLPLFSRKTFTKEICLAGSAALLACGCLLVLTEQRVFVDLRPAVRGHPFGADEAAGAKAAALRLRRSPPTTGPLVVAGWPGYAVTLYADRVSNKMLLVSTDPPLTPLKGPAAGALLVRDAPKHTAPRLAQWQRALHAQFSPQPAWTADGWSYYRARVAVRQSTRSRTQEPRR